MRSFFRLIRPFFLLEGVVLYALGAGIARYLGSTLDAGFYLLGQFWVMSLQIGALALQAYFSLVEERRRPGAEDPSRSAELLVVLLSLVFFTAAATVAVALLAGGRGSSTILALMFLMFLAAVFYSAPPLRLETSGYGELIVSVVIATLIPAFAFLIQGGDSLRMTAMSAFPLVCLRLAFMLAVEFPLYAAHVKHNRRTMLVRMGWERGMLFNNFLILFAFIVLALAVVFGMPLAIAAPGFLLLPLGGWQIIVMSRIASGAKPQWRSYTLTTAALYGALAYLLAFGFWIR